MNVVHSHRMFLRVYPNTYNPVMGGFIILKDHKPQGPYKEVLFKGHIFPLITAQSTGTTTGTFWRASFRRETTQGDLIDGDIFSGIANLGALAAPLASRFPAMGTIKYNITQGTIEISDPISPDLVCLIERGTALFTQPTHAGQTRAEEPKAQAAPAKKEEKSVTETEHKETKEEEVKDEMGEDVEDIWPEGEEEDIEDDDEEEGEPKEGEAKKEKTPKKKKQSRKKKNAE